MSKPTLADMLAQPRTPIPFPIDDTVSAATGWPRRIPLVDSLGFLITLVPKGTELYNEIKLGCTLIGTERWFQVHIRRPAPIKGLCVNTPVEDASCHTIDITVLEVGKPTVDAPTLNLVAMVTHFRKELIADPKIPDLRDWFR